MTSTNELLGDPGLGRLLTRKKRDLHPEFDVTAMVDLVFMMNIYFLVTFVTVALGEINLPAANHCLPVDADSAVVVTVLGSLDGKSVQVYLGGEVKGEAIADADEQDRRIRAAAEQGAAAGKTAVLLKAEKKVRIGQLFRLAAAAAVDGVKLHVGVHEKDSSR